jgi:hypothetical protein
VHKVLLLFRTFFLLHETPILPTTTKTNTNETNNYFKSNTRYTNSNDKENNNNTNSNEIEYKNSNAFYGKFAKNSNDAFGEDISDLFNHENWFSVVDNSISLPFSFSFFRSTLILTPSLVFYHFFYSLPTNLCTRFI